MCIERNQARNLWKGKYQIFTLHTYFEDQAPLHHERESQYVSTNVDAAEIKADTICT